ncbi:hypothetical protein L6274_01895 [Candidatus Parcubacteria bacterium]|nr:hypothetical protein [Candidatus Parcubacteria bacterium]
MLELIILILIIIGLIIHRYLTNFWEQGMLPYAMGFLMFVNIFSIIYLINFVWMFGFVLGIIIATLTFFQIVFASFLWPFLLPQLISVHKDQLSSKLFSKLTNANPFIYGSFSFLIIGLGLLTIINFFVSDYSSLTKTIVEFFDGNYITPILWIVGVAVVSNVIRSYALSKFLKRDSVKEPRVKNSEVEEATKILNEAEEKFGTDFNIVREYVEKGLDANKDQFSALIQKGGSVRKYIYTVIANVSGDLAESGQYHIYRGVLNPMGPGESLLKIFDSAMNELVKLSDTDKKNAETQKKAIRENIKSVG